jgi:copper chaperone CopZ
MERAQALEATMKEKIASIGALTSAAFASVCCLGPIVLVALGLGGAGLAAGLEKYRPIFLGLTTLFLGVAFYVTYRKREVACADGSCELRSGDAKTKAILWAITALAVSLAAFPTWSAYVLRRQPAVSTAGAETTRLAISGMTCTACAVGIEKSLMKVPGVRSASVDFDKAEAVVLGDPGAVQAQELLKAVQAVGAYTAEVVR